MHSIEYGYGLESFHGIWQKNSERISHNNLRNADDYYIPNPRVESFKYIPLYSFPLEWNKLAVEIKYQYNRHTFKIALKDHLLEKIEI